MNYYWILPLISLCLGSFASVFVSRYPVKDNLYSVGSRCPFCYRKIEWFYNIPVLGWLFLGGRCSQCKNSISWLYPFLELSFCLVSFLPFSFFKPSAVAAYFYVFFTLLLLIAWTDLKTNFIYDILTYPLILGGLIASWLFPTLYASIWDSWKGVAVVGFGMFFVASVGSCFFKKQVLGGGDIKLMAGVGGVLGWKHGLDAIALGYLLGGCFAPLAFSIGIKRKDPIPFGPFLVFGTYLSCFDFLSQGRLFSGFSLLF